MPRLNPQTSCFRVISRPPVCCRRRNPVQFRRECPMKDPTQLEALLNLLTLCPRVTPRAPLVVALAALLIQSAQATSLLYEPFASAYGDGTCLGLGASAAT